MIGWRNRRGIALVETLIGLALLATAGLALVGLLRQAVVAAAEDRKQETMFAAADRVLVAMSLLRRTELEQRIGRHPVGEYMVDVERPEPTLFRIAIARTDAPARELLVTLVYRPAREGR